MNLLNISHLNSVNTDAMSPKLDLGHLHGSNAGKHFENSLQQQVDRQTQGFRGGNDQEGFSGKAKGAISEEDLVAEEDLGTEEDKTQGKPASHLSYLPVGANSTEFSVPTKSFLQDEVLHTLARQGSANTNALSESITVQAGNSNVNHTQMTATDVASASVDVVTTPVKASQPSVATVGLGKDASQPGAALSSQAGQSNLAGQRSDGSVRSGVASAPVEMVTAPVKASQPSVATVGLGKDASQPGAALSSQAGQSNLAGQRSDGSVRSGVASAPVEMVTAPVKASQPSVATVGLGKDASQPGAALSSQAGQSNLAGQRSDGSVRSDVASAPVDMATSPVKASQPSVATVGLGKDASQPGAALSSQAGQSNLAAVKTSVSTGDQSFVSSRGVDASVSKKLKIKGEHLQGASRSSVVSAPSDLKMSELESTITREMKALESANRRQTLSLEKVNSRSVVELAQNNATAQKLGITSHLMPSPNLDSAQSNLSNIFSGATKMGEANFSDESGKNSDRNAPRSKDAPSSMAISARSVENGASLSLKPISAVASSAQVMQKVVESIALMVQGVQRNQINLSLDLAQGKKLQVALRINKNQVKVVFNTESEALRIAIREGWDQLQKQVAEKGLEAGLPEFLDQDPGQSPGYFNDSNTEESEYQKDAFAKTKREIRSPSPTHSSEVPVVASTDVTGFERYA